MTTERRLAWLTAAFVALACIVLYGPALGTGFLADDLFQISMLEGRFGSYSPAHLYAFAPEDPVSTAAHVRRGSLPWWTHPDFRFVMVRPLSSLLLSFDHWVWPRQAYAHHLHSALWFTAVLWCAYALVRRVTSRSVALVAVALFSIDETMTWMVAWLANRCALVCTMFALLALIVHHRASHRAAPSRRQRAKDAGLELGLWLAAFAGGEYAVGGVAYLGAYALLGDPRPFKTRMLAIWPAVVALLVFFGAYVVLRGGVYGGTTYVDPFGETGRFFQAAAHRIPRMVGEVWINMAGESERFWLRYAEIGLSARVMPPDINDLDVQAFRHGAFSVVTSALFVGPAWWLARRYWTEGERVAVRWVVLGSFVALIPIAAIPPATRSLLFPNLGPAVFVAACSVAAVRAWRTTAQAPRRWSAVVLAVWSAIGLYVHGPRECVYARQQLDALLGAQKAYATYYDSAEFTQLDLEGKHVVVVATPGLVTGIHGISMMHVLGMPIPKTWHVLGMGPRPYMIRRIGKRKLELSGVGAPMHRTPQEVLFRSHKDALRTGAKVDAGLFVAKVLSDGGGVSPVSVLFRFDWDLDDPRLVFLEVGPGGLKPFPIPALGRAVGMRPPALPKTLPDSEG